MARPRAGHHGCFPTGVPYPGIAALLKLAPTVAIGLAAELSPDAIFAQMPLAVIDTETTGKETARGHRIIEIAVVHFDRGVVTARHALRVDPGMEIPAEATAIHGIAKADLKGCPRWRGVAPRVLALLRGRVPLAYNADFDRGFVFSEMRSVGVKSADLPTLPPALRPSVDWIDPLMWARALQAGAKGFKLGEVCGRLDIALVNAHRAADDAEAAGLAMLALLGTAPTTYRDVVQRQRVYAQNDQGPFRRKG